MLTAEQRNVYDKINLSIAAQQGGFYYLDAPGGTGKTFLISLILTSIRSQNHIALAFASSGIAATLLDGGRTAHTALKLNPDAMCNIKQQSGMAEVLRKCKIIIWDECTMAHKHSLEALDRTLRDIRNNRRLFGGALPDIPRATYANEINTCLKESYLWRHKTMVATKEELMQSIFPEIEYNYTNHTWLRERVILAAKNVDVDTINFKIQQSLPGNEFTFKSIGTVVDPDEVVNYPVEFLNSLDLTGMPPHYLRLKIGSPIILLRNLNAPKLCNDTRLVTKKSWATFLKPLF
ncbi:uncharacterized protein LOC120779309 [Bactrocera tryoni]|uniref:uncharacterized protein LOC120779309 n=1 Tax=Bactrocera tryoni TaxID=59916 RepID=UPI001A974FC7|nr:uncharacterized protein LOC120779309 [Bactrocera tryoni]